MGVSSLEHAYGTTPGFWIWQELPIGLQGRSKTLGWEEIVNREPQLIIWITEPLNLPLLNLCHCPSLSISPPTPKLDRILTLPVCKLLVSSSLCFHQEIKSFKCWCFLQNQVEIQASAGTLITRNWVLSPSDSLIYNPGPLFCATWKVLGQV